MILPDDHTPTQKYPEPAAPLTEMRLGDDTVLVLDHELALVSSKTEPGVWHIVTAQQACTCKGYQYRGSCRHLRRIADLELIGQAGVPTAEERVAQRLDDPAEQGFYAALDAAADAHPDEDEWIRIFKGRP